MKMINQFSTFFPNNAVNRSFLLALLFVVVSGCGGGSDATTGAGGSANAASEVGTWALATANGAPGGEGITLTLTGSTYTFDGPGCTETGTYTVSGSTISGTVSTVTGAGTVCDPVGSSFKQSYTVTETTLTITESNGTVLVWNRI